MYSRVQWTRNSLLFVSALSFAIAVDTFLKNLQGESLVGVLKSMLSPTTIVFMVLKVGRGYLLTTVIAADALLRLVFAMRGEEASDAGKVLSATLGQELDTARDAMMAKPQVLQRALLDDDHGVALGVVRVVQSQQQQLQLHGSEVGGKVGGSSSDINPSQEATGMVQSRMTMAL